MTWLATPSALGYEFFFAAFVGFLVAALLGYWPLPIAFEIAPVILMGFALWNGYFTRAQKTELIRLAYVWKPGPRGTTSPSPVPGSDLGSYEVVVSYGIATSHNGSKPGFRSVRNLDRIESAPTGDATMTRVFELLRYFTGGASPAPSPEVDPRTFARPSI